MLVAVVLTGLSPASAMDPLLEGPVNDVYDSLPPSVTAQVENWLPQIQAELEAIILLVEAEEYTTQLQVKQAMDEVLELVEDLPADVVHAICIESINASLPGVCFGPDPEANPPESPRGGDEYLDDPIYVVWPHDRDPFEMLFRLERSTAPHVPVNLNTFFGTPNSPPLLNGTSNLTGGLLQQSSMPGTLSSHPKVDDCLVTFTWGQRACNVVFLNGVRNFKTPKVGLYHNMSSAWNLMTFLTDEGDRLPHASPFETAARANYYGGSCDTELPAALFGGFDLGHAIHHEWHRTLRGHPTGNTNCDGDWVHGINAEIEHLSYHVAWMLHYRYGGPSLDPDPVSLVAHSMGGLVFRSALLEVDRGEDLFPEALNIDNVVTLGTPHQGSHVACTAHAIAGATFPIIAGGLLLFDTSPMTQYWQLCGASGYQKQIFTEAQYPDPSPGPVRWVNIVSECDEWVSSRSGVGMEADAKIIYLDGSPFSQCYEHSDYYRNHTGIPRVPGSIDRPIPTAPMHIKIGDGAWFEINGPMVGDMIYYALATDPRQWGPLPAFKLNPEVETLPADQVTATEARLNGELHHPGTSGDVQVQFRYGLDPNSLSQSTPWQPMGRDPGAFEAQITGLASTTTYYFKAVADGVFGHGTGEGEVLSFTTGQATPPSITTLSAQSVDQSSATLRANLGSLGSASSVDVQFEWGTSPSSLNQQTPTQTRTSTGTVFQQIQGLNAGSTYYYRAVAVGDGTVVGSVVSFTTTGPPSVTTEPADQVGTTTARLRGVLDSLGSWSNAGVRFEWGTSPNFLTEQTPFQSMSSPGPFDEVLQNLDPGTTYYFRAHASSQHGDSRGSVHSFTTPLPSAPWVDTRPAENIEQNLALIRGALNDLGSASSVTVYFEWGTSSTNLNQQTPTQTRSTTGFFIHELTGLNPSTTYYYRAVGVGDGTTYGSVRAFTTLDPPRIMLMGGGPMSGHGSDVWNSANGGAWSQLTSSAVWSDRTRFSSVFHDGKVWTMGGSAGSTLFSDVWHSTNGQTWNQAAASAPWGPRNLHSSVVHDGKIWVIGGHDGSGWTNDVWHSTDGTTWTQATSSAPWAARGAHTSVVHDGKIWVIGGNDFSGAFNDVWHSTDGASWTQATIAAPWSGRLSHTSVVHDGKIWVMGGLDQGSNMLRDVWHSTNGVTWTQATSSAPWSARWQHASVAFDGFLWVMGGADSGGDRSDVWRSSNGSSWTQVTSSAPWSDRRGHEAVVYS